jgi:four helix bundle protein
MTLRIYAVAIEMVREVAVVVQAIARVDPDLARQLRRAAASVPLNIAEGSQSRGRNRAARYQTAMGSAQEVIACVDVAEAMGIASVPSGVRDRADRVIATLRKIVR